MKILANKESLLNSISTIEKIVPAREIKPVASNILLEASDKHTILSCTDFEINFRDKVETTVKTAGKVCLPAKKISQILKQMHCEIVSIVANPDDSKVLIQSGEEKNESKAVVTIVSANIEDFPEMKFPKTSDFHGIDAEVLVKMIKRIDYAMAEEDARYIFNGMFLHYVDGELIVVATDGRRLSVCREKMEKKIEFGDGIVVPFKSIREIRRILEITHTAYLYYDKKDQKLFLKSNNLDFSTRLIEGQYPNFEQVIPKKIEHRLKINKEDFQKKLRLNAVMAAEPSRQIIFTFANKELTMNTSTPDLGKAEDVMEIPDFNGKEFKIALNSKYLFDVLQIIESENLIMEISSESSPLILLDEESSGFKALIMPMKI